MYLSATLSNPVAYGMPDEFGTDTTSRPPPPNPIEGNKPKPPSQQAVSVRFIFA
jgi:hypothetical protein